MGKKDKGKKAKALTGLAAALVKSGHLSEKKAKDLARGQRREDKTLGRKGMADREAEKQAQAVTEREAEAARARARAEERKTTDTQDLALRSLRENLHQAPGGGRRWFFAARDGRVIYMDLSDSVAGLLARGQAGIAETLGVAPTEHGVVTSERALVTLVGIDPEIVRFWNREVYP